MSRTSGSTVSEVLDLLREEGLFEPFANLYRRAQGREWFAPAPITIQELRNFYRMVTIGLFLLDPISRVQVNQQANRITKNEIIAEVTPLGSAVGDATLGV